MIVAAAGTCDGCTLCCVVFKIDALAKPPFRACRHVGGRGCTIYDDPARPEVCGGFVCRHIEAHRKETPERDLLPHPAEAGAYVFRQPGARAMIVCVDPARPHLWRASRLPDFLRAAMDRGFQVAVHDRGYSFSIAERDHLEEVVAQDCVAVADALGIAPNGAGFAGLD